MGRPERPVDPSRGSVATFARDLRKLREQAGSPTYRDMARRALFSPSVLSSAASGHRLPTLPVTLAFVAACGGDPEIWRRRWLQVSGAGRADPAASSTAPARPSHPGCREQPGLPRPAQLPPRPQGFFARAAELHRLTGSSLTAPVVITGPVGVGKSEFALHLAHDAAATMVDGQLYADLRLLATDERGAQAVLTGLLPALGVPIDQLPGSANGRAGLYRSLLVERRLVVLLDNVRDERQVRPLLAEARRSLTIVVGRTALLGLRDVHRVRLAALPRTESVAMIVAVVADRARADPEACEQLAELCGDLPLALDIAARKLVARPNLALRWVTHRLADPGNLLDWLRIGDLSVRESLGSAYWGLTDPARLLLHRLAGLPISDCRWCCLHDEQVDQQVDELVEELVEAGMLRRRAGSGGNRIDPLARAFLVGQPLPLSECHSCPACQQHPGQRTRPGRSLTMATTAPWPGRPARRPQEHPAGY